MKVYFFVILLVIVLFLIPQNSYAISITASPRTAHFGPNDWIKVDLAINGYVGGNVIWIAHRPDNSTISGSLGQLHDGKITHQIIRSAYDNYFGKWSIDYTYSGIKQTASFIVDPVILSVKLDKGLYYDGDTMKINVTTSFYIPKAQNSEYYHLHFYDKKGNLAKGLDRIDINAFEPSTVYDFPIDSLVHDNPVGKYKIKIQYYNVFAEVPFEVGDIEKLTTISVKTDKSLYHVGDNVDMNILFSKVRESQALIEITDPSGNTTTNKFPITAVGTKLHLEKAAMIQGTYRFEIHYAGVTQPGSFIVETPEFTPNTKIILTFSFDKTSYRPGETINATIHANLVRDSVSFWFEDPSGKQGDKNSIPVTSVDTLIFHKINKNDMRGLWKLHVDYGVATKFSSFHVEGVPIEDADDIANAVTPPPLLLTLGSGDIKFKNPRGIAIDSADNVYVVDSGNSEIKKFGSTGKFLASLGTFGDKHGQFKNPTGIFTDKKYVYVADTGNARIQKFDKNGNFVYAWGEYGDGPGMFHTPVSLAADNSGDLFVSDSGINKILVFDSNGQYKDEIRSPITAPAKFSSSNFITFDSKNNFYLVISSENRVLQYGSIGTFINSFGTAGDKRGQFDMPNSIDIDSGGNLYVADTKNHRIQKFDSHGNFLRSWSTLGTGSGQFKEPVGIAIDSKDNVYVVDKENNTVQKFSSYTPDKIVIPDWIRNNAKWWSQGMISDSDFAGGIQYMIKQKIIHIPNGESPITDSGVSIPSWIKTNAGWWSDKKISDTSFVNGIQYLISIGIIR